MRGSKRTLSAIMFTDISGYSSLSQENEPLALETLKEHNEIIRSVLPNHNGREIKTIGDSFLIEFESALEAVSCALEMQSRFRERHDAANKEHDILIRIGIHLGDVVHQEGDILGDGVNIASRIEPIAGPGEICISRQVYDQVHNKIKENLVSLGEYDLKNIATPVVIYKVLLPWQTEHAAKAHKAVVMEKSIVVLPFADMSQHGDQEYFCDGIAEDLIDALSKIKSLKVVARTSSFAFKNKNIDIREIGRALNVQYVVEGSVRKSRDKLRVTAQFINVSDGCHIWSEKYDRTMEDIFDIQDELTIAIVDNLKISLMGDEKKKLTEHHTENIEAYSTYMRGRYFWNRRSDDAIEKALHCFYKAIELDPEFALPYSGIADAYNMLGTFSFLPPAEAYPKARELAMKAIELDGSLGAAYTSLAWIKGAYEFESEDALELFEKAIKLSPNYPSGHSMYGMYLLALGRLEEALQQIKTALRLDPMSLIINANLALIYGVSGKREESIEQYKKTLEMEPGFVTAHVWLGATYMLVGLHENAFEHLNNAIKIGGDTSLILGYLGFIHARLGHKDEVTAVLKRFEELSGKRYVSPCAKGYIHLGQGDHDKAFSLFEKAYEERDPLLIHLFHMSGVIFSSDLGLEKAAHDPRTRSILERIGVDFEHKDYSFKEIFND